MESPRYTIWDLGDERVLAVDGKEYRTHYSERVIRMLIERKGLGRAPLYFPFKVTRGGHFLDRLFAALAARRLTDLAVLEVGCSFGHITEYLDDQPLVGGIWTFDSDAAFVEMTRAKVEDLRLSKVREVRYLVNEETRRLPYVDGAFDLVIVLGVIEHLPLENRHRYVDEYYRVLKAGGWIGIFDTPNRWFPLETHSVGLPLIQWLPPRAALAYGKVFRPGRLRGVTPAEFTAPGTGWRNASLSDCLPTSGRGGLEDLTEEIGYGYRFFRDTARSWKRRLSLPAFAFVCQVAWRLGISPSLFLPYFNLVLRKVGELPEK
ncbi:MAG: class I SAM-dependent methyltransferase [Candidatus Rokubacteria bacterium]|nr:class I SAM-dependent methyltransferase [Candidatus Rokubacteria bacterium]